MISGYIALRDKKNALKKEHIAVLKPYNEALEKIEDVLRGHLQANQLQSISGKDGTAFLKRTRSATVADASLFRGHVIANEDFDLADFRANPEAVESYVEDHKGGVPPGVNFSTSIDVFVQRK
jgi:hypothetical protein